MGYFIYQNKAWEIMKEKIDELVKNDTDGRYKEMQKIMRDSSSEAFNQPTKTEDVADLLMDAVNSSTFSNEVFANQITNRTHRTLQQSFMRAVKACVDGWSELYENEWYDARNEATVKQSAKIRELLKDDNLPLI